MNLKSNKIIISCDYCGAEIMRYPSKIKKHNFCGRSCLAAFSSKTKNPNRYDTLKNFTGMSENMKRLNAALNPNRMTPEVKQKLRNVQLAKYTSRKSYPKFFGRHVHRTVAELKLGRSLKPGEVVHHIDGNKQNSDCNNLMIFPSQAEHAAWHTEHDIKKGDDAV